MFAVLVDDFANLCKSGASYQSVESELLDLLEVFGITSATAIELAQTGAGRQLGTVLGKQESEYILRYRDENLARVDVAAHLAATDDDAFYWSDAYKQCQTESERAVFAIAREHGHRDGFVVPVPSRRHRGGFVSFIGDEIDTARGVDHALHMCGIHFYLHSQRQSKLERRQSQSQLTPRQTEILKWVSDGKTDWEISGILGISQNTVNRHVEMAKERLDVTSRTQAVTVARDLGYIAQ